jgi:DNA modification methylase
MIWRKYNFMEENVDLYLGDCLEELRSIPDNSVDSIVTDPPYGLSNQPDMMEVLRHWMAGDDYTHKGKGFMGKSWDSFVPGPSVWKECLRVLKPGGHLLCFAGTRTQDMMGLAIRLAGFELRDSLVWAYGSGFPKSHNISVAIDKLAGADREVVGFKTSADGRCRSAEPSGNQPRNSSLHGGGIKTRTEIETAPATEAAKQWDGWGSALKPAYEPVLLCRKPLEGTLAQNTLKHGCGGINIDGCRVETGDSGSRNHGGKVYEGVAEGYQRPNKSSYTHKTDWQMPTQGRFPANLIHDGSEEVVACFPDSKSTGGANGGKLGASVYGKFKNETLGANAGGLGDAGSAARFFKACPNNDPEDMEARRIIYCAKASKKDRGVENKHPTVKPTELMRYLVRLVTPPEGVVLDPFMGSGSTGKAAMLEGFRFIGIEREPEYLRIAAARIKFAIEQNTK